MQARAIKLVADLRLDKAELIVGLPAYDQATLVASGEVNMYRAVKQSICARTEQIPPNNIVGDSYFSMRNIMSKTRDAAYARRFLRSCTIEAVQRACGGKSSNDLVSELERICPEIAN